MNQQVGSIVQLTEGAGLDLGPLRGAVDNACAEMDRLRAENAALKLSISDAANAQAELEAALIHMNEVGKWDPRGCKDCAKVQRLCNDIYAKRVAEATK